MFLREIPLRDWKRFCSRFSQIHRGWSVCIERKRIRQDVRGKRLANRLRRILFLPDDPAIVVEVMAVSGEREVMGMLDPQGLRVGSDEEGTVSGLEIRLRSGNFVTLRFPAHAGTDEVTLQGYPPETVPSTTRPS